VAEKLRIDNRRERFLRSNLPPAGLPAPIRRATRELRTLSLVATTLASITVE
jgi:hypothetical protein